jgi:hypothetical protein
MSATQDAATLLGGLSHLAHAKRRAAEGRLVQELQRSIARNSAIAARCQRTLAAVLEALEARPE